MNMAIVLSLKLTLFVLETATAKVDDLNGALRWMS